MFADCGKHYNKDLVIDTISSLSSIAKCVNGFDSNTSINYSINEIINPKINKILY